MGCSGFYLSRQANTLLIDDVVSIPHRNAKYPLASPPSTSQPLLHSKHQPQLPLLVDEFDDFLPWLERKAGADISSALSIGKSAYGTSLFASKSIRAGDCVLKVPYSLVNLNPKLSKTLITV
ncbi:histone-lysine N-methyltransferase setd3 [Pyrus ussuriensis x Pyrus communis]|uniref:Histone-lysine N-methyltransferase setd3 n=1 Tax=Pyrus ussuriensis x Pyrus communis TaxID=2448454 RepID=A0A5N5F213_9ROSA|nr:histone-lysine N-methyltransferase setd3 [Pyrus ussuriensis x Pyrus communis]